MTNPTARRLRTALLGCAALTSVGLAQAEAAPTASVFFSGLYGRVWSAGTPTNPFGPGLELRAGLTLSPPVYLGVALQHYFGVSVIESLPIEPSSVSLNRVESQSRVLAHVGYAWDLGGLTLSPTLGIGYSLAKLNLTTTFRGSSTERGSTAHGLALSPGVELAFPIGRVEGNVQLRHDSVVRSEDDRHALVVGVGIGFAL